MQPRAQLAIHKRTRGRSEPNLTNDQYTKQAIEYLKGTATQGLIIKTNIEKKIALYADFDFEGICNQS